MNSQPYFNVCILNWNGGSHLSDCIDSILENKYSNYRVTVIDNNSKDNSAFKIDSRVKICRLDKNYGFALGYNLGIDKILSEEDEFLVLLNFDTILKNNFFDCLANSIKIYNQSNIFGVKILYENNRDMIWYAGGKVDLKNGLIEHAGIRHHRNSITSDSETDYITGCCMVIHKDTLKLLEGFDDRFFMYNEDVDLCLRAKEKSIKSIFLNSPEIYHKVSVSLDGNYSYKKFVMKIKSTFLLYRKSFTFFGSCIYFSFYVIRSGLKFLFRS